MKGSTFRRCGCRDASGKQLGQSCPKLASRRHGTWGWRQELPPAIDGDRQTLRKSGYESKTDAVADLDKVRALLAIPDPEDAEGRTAIAELLRNVVANGEPLPDHDETRRRFRSGQRLATDLLLSDYLDDWLTSKKIRKSGKARYETDIRCHLKPHLGHLRVSRLRISHIAEMFAAIDEQNDEIEASIAVRRETDQRRREAAAGGASRAVQRALAAEMRALPPFRRVTSKATQLRIKATLRAALNAAMTDQLIVFNPAAHVEVESPAKSKALIWTDERVQRWRETGERPGPVMVWTPAHTGAFLDFVAEHRLYGLFHLIAFRGLRRGEACGARVVDLDLKARTLTIAKQLVQDGWKVEESDPKTDSSNAAVALDEDTVAALKARLQARDAEKEEWGEDWIDSGRIFTRENGEWIHPGWLSEEFERLVARSELPPVRLHDLRHGAATLMLASGAQMKLVQETLRHSSITITSNIYTSVLPELAFAAAEASVKIVPRVNKPVRAAAEVSPL
jgi:integrase